MDFAAVDGGFVAAADGARTAERLQHTNIEESPKIKETQLSGFARLINKVSKLQLKLFQRLTLT